jgi:RNA polymerase sigma factor (sigma-70 family)
MLANRGVISEDMDQVEEDFNQLYLCLQRYSLFLTKNKWDAEDLAQEAFIKAYQHYASTTVNQALLNKIAYHHWIDTTRKRKQEIIGAHLKDWEEIKDLSRIMDTVQLLVNNLTPKQAIVFLLKEAFQYQTKEIADILDSTETAIKGTILRAKKRMERVGFIQGVDFFWSREDKEVLSDLIYQSLHDEDPAILVDCISKLPLFVEASRIVSNPQSSSLHNLYCFAA